MKRCVLATGASLVATANPGCHLQLENALKAIGADAVSRPVTTHPIILLAAAYRAEAQ